MLNWQPQSNGAFQAETEYFKYVVEAIDGQFYWSLWIGETLLLNFDRLGPFALRDALAAAQKDYDARIAHGEKVTEHG